MTDIEISALTLDPSTPSFVSFVDNGDGTGTATLSLSSLDVGAHVVQMNVTDGQPVNDSASLSFDVTVSAPTSRVVDGLAALFTFDDGPGPVVTDVSGVGAPLDLLIDDIEAMSWGSGSLTVEASVGISTAGAADKINSAVTASGELTMEAWIAPADTIQSGPARIISISKSSTRRNVTLGQGGVGNTPGDRHDVRLRSTSTFVERHALGVHAGKQLAHRVDPCGVHARCRRRGQHVRER